MAATHTELFRLTWAQQCSRGKVHGSSFPASAPCWFPVFGSYAPQLLSSTSLLSHYQLELVLENCYQTEIAIKLRGNAISFFQIRTLEAWRQLLQTFWGRSGLFSWASWHLPLCCLPPHPHATPPPPHPATPHPALAHRGVSVHTSPSAWAPVWHIASISLLSLCRWACLKGGILEHTGCLCKFLLLLSPQPSILQDHQLPS